MPMGFDTGLSLAFQALLNRRPGSFAAFASHSDFTITLNPRAESKIRQGIATEVVGADMLLRFLIL